MTTQDKRLAADLDTFADHTCCYSPAEVNALLTRVRLQAVLQAADYFSAAHARLGGETYPEDMRDYATETYGVQQP